MVFGHWRRRQINWAFAMGIVGGMILVFLHFNALGQYSPRIPVTLWAWERPEQLTFLPESTPVAYLAQTIYLWGDRLSIHSRQQPLILPLKAQLTAVVRIEISHNNPPTLSMAQIGQVAEQIVTSVRRHPNVGVQIDFDARVSERLFYSRLLNRLRQQLPATTRLSMTALASWCLYDHWLEGLPVSEAVPMVFRMGVDTKKIEQYLRSGQDFQVPICRHSIGVSTDEPIRKILFRSVGLHGIMAGRMIYIFNPHPWQVMQWQQIQKEIDDAQ